MQTIVFDGRAAARRIREEIREEAKKEGLVPTLAVVLVGQNSASLSYIKRKEEACAELGFGFVLHRLPENASQKEVGQLIQTVNYKRPPHGLLLQLPLPSALSGVAGRLISKISPSKDIDGLTPNSPFTPPTALAVLHVLRSSHFNVEGANAVVLGRGQTAGKPVFELLKKLGAKVNFVHSQTPLSVVNSQLLIADIVISCVGQPNFIKGGMIKEGAAVIGVGLSRTNSRISEEGYSFSAKPRNEETKEGVTFSAPNRLQGDLDEYSLIGQAKLITPTPGGIGPLTVAFLLKNLLRAARLQRLPPTP